MCMHTVLYLLYTLNNTPPMFDTLRVLAGCAHRATSALLIHALALSAVLRSQLLSSISGLGRWQCPLPEGVWRYRGAQRRAAGEEGRSGMRPDRVWRLSSWKCRCCPTAGLMLLQSHEYSV